MRPNRFDTEEIIIAALSFVGGFVFIYYAWLP